MRPCPVTLVQGWSVPQRNLDRPSALRMVGAVAQLGERLVRNEEVSGSIPLSSTKSAITRERKRVCLLYAEGLVCGGSGASA